MRNLADMIVLIKLKQNYIVLSTFLKIFCYIDKKKKKVNCITRYVLSKNA